MEVPSHHEVPQTVSNAFTEVSKGDVQKSQAVSDSAMQNKELGSPSSNDYGKVIVLVGGSSAGKSTIIKALREKDPSYQEKGMDLAFRDVIIRRIRTADPTLFNQLETALKEDPSNWASPNAVWDKNFDYDNALNFKPNITSEQRLLLKEACIKLRDKLKEPAAPGEDVKFMLDSVLSDCLIGKQTVIDLLNIDNIAKHALMSQNKISVKIAVIYCPFNEIAERVAKRNEGARPEDRRSGLTAYIHYAKVFKRKENDNEIAVEKLTRESCVKAFENNYDAEPELKTQRLNDFLFELGFSDPAEDSIEVTPRFSDTVLDLIREGKITNPEIISSGKRGIGPTETAKKLLS